MASSISSSAPSPVPPSSAGGAQISAVTGSDPSAEREPAAEAAAPVQAQGSPPAPRGSGRGENVDILV